MSSQPTHEWPASKSIISLERTPRSGRLHMSFVLPLPRPDRGAPVTGWVVSAGRPCDNRHLAPTRGEVSECSCGDGQSEPRLN